MHIFASIYLSAHPSKSAELLKYIHTVRLGVARGSTGWYDYDTQYRLRKALNPTSSWGEVDAELWLLYMSSKLVNHHQSTQSSVSGHKCFDYNYKGNCLKSNCQYSHSCICCAGMHPVISCNQTKLQSYTQNGQRTSQSSFRTNPISSSMSYTIANHSFGLQSQQQQWRPQQYQPSRFTYRATQKHLGPRKNPNQ